MDDAERKVYMSNIHYWDVDVPKDQVEALPHMEQYMMNVLSYRLNDLLDPSDPTFRPFCHDFMDGLPPHLLYVTASLLTKTSRMAIRRHLGCGHFILCLIYIEYNSLEKKYGENWPNLDWWRSMKEDLHAKDLMNPQAPCDYKTTYQWMHNFYQQLFDRMPEETRESVRIPFTLLNVVGPCNRHESESSLPYVRNYAEFLVFHLHNMHELGLLGSGGPQLAQYYKLISLPNQPPPQQVPMSQSLYVKRVVTTITRRALNVHKSLNVAVGQVVTSGAGFTKVLNYSTMSKALKGQSSSYHEVNKWERTRNRNRWYHSRHWERSNWEQINSSLSVRVVRLDWKLGCGGCPKRVVLKRWWAVKKGPRKRFCKWVTIKYTVVVRRVIWFKRRPVRRPRRINA